ncbi:MAG: class III extradiol ring-cleavage dioxygenase, partial [Woeseia sp.]
MAQRMPALFIGHGSPLNAVTENRYSGAWAEIGCRVPTPTAILVVSAHWYVPGVRVTAMQRPRTIHDFGGFPQALYNMQYPAPGDPALAQKIAGVLSPAPVVLDTDWGLDHGTWS